MLDKNKRTTIMAHMTTDRFVAQRSGEELLPQIKI